MPANGADSFRTALAAFAQVLRTARRNRCNLGTHRVYAPRSRTAVAALRRTFILLKRNYPPERFPAVAFQIAVLEPLVDRIVASFPGEPDEMIRLSDEVALKVDSDLSAEIEASGASTIAASTTEQFLPEEIIPDTFVILKSILWEINRTYDAACYNGCAAMIRRLVESLIIEAFEHHQLRARIQRDGEYVELRELIGKCCAEPAFRLTRNTTRVLPDLKFFGDMGVHNRNALVRKADLDRLHAALRGAIDELAANL